MRSTTDPRAGSARPWRTKLVRSTVALAAAVGVAASVAACGGSSNSIASKPSSGSSAGVTVQNAAATSLLTGGTDISGKTVLWNYQSVESNSFGVPLLNGAKAAAKLAGLKLDIQYGGDDDSTQSNQIKTAIAKGEAGFAVGVADSGLNAALCQASKTGKPVVTFNINGSSGPATKCVQSFVGQSFVEAGQLIAQYMVDHGQIKKGDKVFCPVESPSQVYAVQRRQGVNNVLGKLGITCQTTGTGTDLARAKSTLVQYLLGHRDTNAIIGLGGTPLAVSEAAVKQTGLKIPIGGFDLSFPQIVSGLKDGAIVASVNQEPYAQGFYAVLQIAFQLKYGIPPMNINTSDNALVTKDNVHRFEALVPQYQ